MRLAALHSTPATPVYQRGREGGREGGREKEKERKGGRNKKERKEREKEKEREGHSERTDYKLTNMVITVLTVLRFLLTSMFWRVLLLSENSCSAIAENSNRKPLSSDLKSYTSRNQNVYTRISILYIIGM